MIYVYFAAMHICCYKAQIHSKKQWHNRLQNQQWHYNKGFIGKPLPNMRS